MYNYGGTEGDTARRRRNKYVETCAEHIYCRNGTLELLGRLGLHFSRKKYEMIGIVADKYGTWKVCRSK